MSIKPVHNYKTMKFFKITNKKENHYGYQFHDGKHILKKSNDQKDPFTTNDNFYYTGFYFHSKENIHHFYNTGYGYLRGYYIREVTFPDDPDFKISKIDDKVWKANMIILGKRYSLKDPETYKILDIKILDIYSAISRKFKKIIPIVINDINAYPLNDMDLAIIWMTAHEWLDKQQLNIIDDTVVQLAIKHGYDETIKTLSMAKADISCKT